MDLAALIRLALTISIELGVFALGLRATLADLTCLFRRPYELGRALFSMNFVMPLVALALGLAFNLKPAVKIALVTLSVSPVPPMFPKKALKAGCKGDYAIGLLVAMALPAIVIIPIAMTIISRLVGVHLRMPASSVAGLVVRTILAPVLVGMGVRKLAPLTAELLAKIVSVSASVLLVLSVLPVLVVSSRVILSLIGNGTLASMTAFALVGFLMGHLLGGPELDNRRILALATSSRHPGIAVAIAHANFPAQTLAVPAVALYLIVSGILFIPYSKSGARKRELRRLKPAS
jgi:BASS family bile acid:Na+ symporter